MILSTAAAAALQNIRAQREQGKTPRMPNIPRGAYPHTAEEQYRAAGAKTMLAVVAACGKSLSNYQRWVSGYRRDAFSDEWGDALAAARSDTDHIFTDDTEGLSSKVHDAGAMVSDLNLKNLTAQLSALAGTKFYPPGEMWIEAAVDDWSSANFELVRSLSSEYIGKLNTIVRDAVEKGLDVSEFRGKIAALSDSMTGWRVQLLARDQVGKLNGSLSKRRQQDVGVTEYTWETAGDERVRGRKKPAFPSHWAMQGKVCRWDNSGVVKEGNEWVPRSADMPRAVPGEDILCRCVGIPNFTEPWAQALKAEAQERGAPAPKETPKLPSHGQELSNAQNARAFRDADESIAKLVKSAESGFRGLISNPDSRGACYYPLVRGIDMHELRPSMPCYDAVWRHEFGHHIDFFAGPTEFMPWSARYLSEAKLDKTSARLLRATVKSTATGAGAQTRNAAELAKALKEKGFTEDELRGLFEEISNRPGDARPGICAKWLAQGDYKSFAQAYFGFAAGTDAEIVNFYDVFNGISKGRDFCGHAAKYWRLDHVSRGAEVFANLTSLLSGPRKKTWRRLFEAMIPEIVEAYDEGVRTIPEILAKKAGRAAA